MRTVTFKSVIDGIAKRLGLVVADVQAVDLATHLESINERVREGVEHDWFPELLLTELRTYRAAYAAGTAYAATAEVYLPGANAYYQALRSTTGNVPATESGGTWTVDPAYWAECAAGYSADDWADATAYVAGDQVRNPANGEYYSCHTAHTSSGSLDLTKFGLLTPFAAYVALDQAGQTAIGECRQMCRRDPRVYPTNPGVIKFNALTAGLVPSGCAYPMAVWIQFREPPPVFTTTAWASGTTYGAGDLAYDATTGECYKSLAAANTNHAVTEAAWWVRVKFPFVIASFVKSAVFADALRADGQIDAALRQDDIAANQLSKASDVALDGQGQFQSATAQTY